MERNHFIQEPILPYHADGEDVDVQKRRETYLKRLAAYLKDPEFRSIEGFPHGTDEAILALSDPPYYTACPNPFIPEIIHEWQEDRRKIREEMGLFNNEDSDEGKNGYHRKPFTSDVSEGKYDPIYRAHSYHTKVPHKAVMRYILHYTDPGDVIFDGFCGTGMTGVAAQMCGNKKEIESLGYRVDKNGIIYDENDPFSRLGLRKVVLNDLSPAATFITYNYNAPINMPIFMRESKQVLREVEKECEWMYETWYPHCDDPNRVKGKINYTVWSEVFRCPNCGEEMVFWDVAMDMKKKKIRKDWECPKCRSLLSKSPSKKSGSIKVERIVNTQFDPTLNETIEQIYRVPVLINYSIGNKRIEKIPDNYDLDKIKKIEDTKIPYEYPTEAMMFVGENWGDSWRAGYHSGITHTNHFFIKRNLWTLACYFNKIEKCSQRNSLLWILTAVTEGCSLLNRERASGIPSKLSGTLYISSTIREIEPIGFLKRKIKKLSKIRFRDEHQNYLIPTFSSTDTGISNNTFDYIFVDPPFGGNLMYSELNFLWETWIGVFTNNKYEAIISNDQNKQLKDYQTLMQRCFSEFYRLLKAGHWMTVEFHNSQNAVWNAIQESLLQAGFIIADVSILDKKQGTFKQVTTSSAVKQDLIISAYKPSLKFEKAFAVKGGTVRGAWDFVQQHLEKLPMPNKVGGRIEIQSERTPYLLYDRMLAFHLVRGLTIPLSASEFYQGLSKGSFLMREGMVFTIPQAHEYDQLRLSAEGVQQLSLFVTDEASAVQWLRGQLDKETGEGPETYAEIQPKFLKQLHTERYEELPELQTILKQNFLQDEEERWYVPDPSRQADLDAIKERALMYEYNEIARGKGKIKVFRSEAITTGFSKAWAEHNYDQIVAVAKRLPEQALQEDPKLKLYVDNARIRASKQPKQEKLL